MPIVTLPTKTHVKKCLVSGFKTKQVLKKVPMLITSTAEPRCTQVHHGSAVSKAAIFPFLATVSQNHHAVKVSEHESHAQDSHRLADALHQLEAFLGKQLHDFIDFVLSADADVTTDAVMLLVILFAFFIYLLEFVAVIGDTGDRIEGKFPLGNHVVEVHVSTIGRLTLVLDEKEEIRRQTEVVVNVKLHLRTHTEQRVLGRKGNLGSNRHIARLGMSVKHCR